MDREEIRFRVAISLVGKFSMKDCFGIADEFVKAWEKYSPPEQPVVESVTEFPRAAEFVEALDFAADKMTRYPNNRKVLVELKEVLQKFLPKKKEKK